MPRAATQIENAGLRRDLRKEQLFERGQRGRQIPIAPKRVIHPCYFVIGRRSFWRQSRNCWCPGRDLNPHSPCGEKDFKSNPDPLSGSHLLSFQHTSTQSTRRRPGEKRVQHAEFLRSDVLAPFLFAANTIAHSPSPVDQFPRTFCSRLFPLLESSMNNNVIRVSRRVAHWALLFGLTATLAFAQTSSFGQAAQGIATEMIAIAKWVGIILCIICGIGLMAGGPGTIAKVSGLVLGLIFALFASPIITWVQAL